MRSTARRGLRPAMEAVAAPRVPVRDPDPDPRGAPHGAPHGGHNGDSGTPQPRSWGSARSTFRPAGSPCAMEQEFREIDAKGEWSRVYQELRQESAVYPYKAAKRPENSRRNRYRDVSPFDHSRVRLQRGDGDYINASLVQVPQAQRSYILAQAPLPNTCGHFWQMVWEQKSRAIVMLNRTVENNVKKCEKYWPKRRDAPKSFRDSSVTLLGEERTPFFTVRELQLHFLPAGETRKVLHFHYTMWPDFGVPESPTHFLDFLFRVRASASLSPELGPLVVHCSAGIGRSGTFCLVDTCLALVERTREGLVPPDVRQVLLQMRHARMGLIQTPEQLRFSYLAILEGARAALPSAAAVLPKECGAEGAEGERLGEQALATVAVRGSDGEAGGATGEADNAGVTWWSHGAVERVAPREDDERQRDNASDAESRSIKRKLDSPPLQLPDEDGGESSCKRLRP
uniref:protein-tyrosine-phosphatase n=1 Tax=Petromyzon marinus TaxID=7757 RepID=A0AAJ7U696_PETMA|nr:tyrosine-protein phosphatase non-receptor type 2 [Petromyzon marinus]